MSADFAQTTFIVGTVLVAVVCIAVLYVLYRAYAKPSKGTVLGHYTLFGRYAGKLYKKLSGIYVDATEYFTNPQLTLDFKNLVLYDVNQLISKMSMLNPIVVVDTKKVEDTKEKTPSEMPPSGEKDVQATALATSKLAPYPATELELLRETAEAFKTTDLNQTYRMIVVRQNIGGSKHIILQIGDTSRSLTEFALHDPRGTLSLSLGPVTKGIIQGPMITLRDDYTIFGFGKCRVHIFKPDDPLKYDHFGDKTSTGDGDSVTEKLTNLAKIAVMVPSTLDVRQRLKSYKQKLRDKEIELAEMGRELSATSIELDWMKRATKGFNVEGGKPVTPVHSAFDMTDVMVVLMASLVGIGGGYYLGDIIGGVIGNTIGLLAALMFVHKRHNH